MSFEKKQSVTEVLAIVSILLQQTETAVSVMESVAPASDPTAIRQLAVRAMAAKRLVEQNMAVPSIAPPSGEIAGHHPENTNAAPTVAELGAAAAYQARSSAELQYPGEQYHAPAA